MFHLTNMLAEPVAAGHDLGIRGAWLAIMILGAFVVSLVAGARSGLPCDSLLPPPPRRGLMATGLLRLCCTREWRSAARSRCCR